MGQVAPDQAFGILRVRITYQGSQTRPSTKNISSADFNIWGEISTNFLKNPSDIFLLGTGLAFDGCWSVSGACNSISLPREEKDDASVRSGRVEEPHFARGIIIRQRDVNARRWLDNGFVRRIVEGQKHIREGACCVYDTLNRSRNA